jgi:hypothetical protein
MSASVTVTRDDQPIAEAYGNHFYDDGGITMATVFVITFSNGVQIAIANYDDRENQDIQIGVPEPSGQVETVNMAMRGTNAYGYGATFIVFDYNNGSLGDVLYTFSDTTEREASFQFTYDTGSGNLTIQRDYSAVLPDSDGNYSSFNGTVVLSTPICYLRDTRILTSRGEVAVESLQPGDLVATRFGGLRPVRWIGTQTFIGLNATGLLAPVCIRAGALGPAQPLHDLWVSPGHAVLLDGHLVCAYLLVDGTTIVQPPHTGRIEYFHLDLGSHDCVLAEGAWAETYYEHLNRDQFDNADSHRAAFPDSTPTIQATCLPYVNQPDHPALPALRAHRIAHFPSHQTAFAKPDGVHLLADGRAILPDPATPGSEGTWRFALPPGLRSLRLRSPAASPHATSGLPDDRRLGLRLRAAILAHDGAETMLDLADPALSAGWHAPEPIPGGAPEGIWRWTDGDADIPCTLLAPTPATLTLFGYPMPTAGASSPTALAA